MQKTAQHLIILAFLAAILLMPTAFISNVTASPYVGVAANDYFNYGKFNVWITPPGAPLLPNQEKFQNITSINFNITTASQTSWDVTFKQKVTFKNGTTKTFDNGGVNLQTGLGAGYLFFISAGLNGGEQIYPQGTAQNFTWTLNETRTDPRWGRKICFYNSTQTWWKEDVLFYRSTIIKWDWFTGVLLSIRDVTAGYGGPGTQVIEGGVSYQLVDTNRFDVLESAPLEMTTLIIVVGAVLAGALVIVVVKTSTTSQKKKWKRLKE